jgi:hypothetical protein
MSVLALILALAALTTVAYLAVVIYRLLNCVLDRLANTITLDLDQETPND